MSVNVKYFGSVPPGPGVNPVRVQVNPKLPFGKTHPVNWQTGKHLSLGGTTNQEEKKTIGSATPTDSDHPFKFIPTSSTTGTITSGTCSIGGSGVTITGLPSSLSGIMFSSKYWIAVNLLTKTATWDSGISYANESSTVRIIPIFEITCSGPSITSWIQRRFCDIRIDSQVAENPGASIDTLGGSSEGSETASSDTWTAGSANGLDEWYVSRVVYNESGDKVVYAFLRKRTYDKYGRLYSVSGETRVAVDATVEHT